MDLFAVFYNSSLRFLSFRPRSEKEVRENLLKNKASTDVINQVIAKLIEQKFLNDFDFAAWWIESRLRFRPRSVRFITMELKQKGISSDIIEEVLEKQENLQVNDKESAKKLLARKIERFKDLPPRELYQKVAGLLSRKGFDYDVIKESIDEILKKRV